MGPFAVAYSLFSLNHLKTIVNLFSLISFINFRELSENYFVVDILLRHFDSC